MNPAPASAPLSDYAAPARVAEARFFELDILRGVAAFLVVLFHYKHFLLDDLGNFDYAHMPLFVVLAPVYVFGQSFVELFFSISGYVFFWLYAEAVAQRRIGLRSFFIARFSRLYPLYFVTLVAVALMQWAFTVRYGHGYIYPHNSAGNFTLNLFMVHQWLPHAEQSFNGPSWSISVEAFLYIAFFALCSWRLNRPAMIAAVVAFGLAFKYLQPQPAADFARGIPNFFMGGLIFYLVQYLRERGREAWMKRADDILLWAVPVLWGLTYLRTHPLVWLPIETWLEDSGIGSWSPLFTTGGFVYILVPLTLLALGLRQGRWLDFERLKAWSWVGDISYSLYLIHFPLQLLLMMGLAGLPFTTRAVLFSSPVVLALFMGLAVWLARLSFERFEMPMRRWLKDWLNRRLQPGPVIG